MKQAALFIIAILLGCSRPVKESNESINHFQGISLLGDSLYTPVYEKARKAKLDSNLNKALRHWQCDPSEMTAIWYGRRTAYLGDYRKAIEIYTQTLRQFPGSYKLYRHRGHRYITLRQFDRAVEDLEKAARLMPGDTLEIEPDGIPNAQNIPLSSTEFNVWYHLGLAHYLRNDLEQAEKAYLKCMEVSVNDDLLCATADWLYMTLRRLGKDEEAATLLDTLPHTMNIIENDAYFKRLGMYKGDLPADSLLSVGLGNPDPGLAIATQGYGVGNWHHYNGDTAKAKMILQKVLDGRHWAAFGFIAAEADMARWE